MFNQNSGLVQAWVNLVRNGMYSKEDIPRLANLQEVTLALLEKKEA